MSYSSAYLVDLLWSTLRKLETQLDASDPELRYLKGCILHSIGELDTLGRNAA